MNESYHWYLASMSPLMASVSLLAAQASYQPHGPAIEVTLANHRSFIITADRRGSPKTVQGIVKLIRKGFYDGQRFHRVEKWVVQWGDPNSRRFQVGDPRLGSGGSGHALAFEGSKAEFARGIVGIASTGTGVGGDSQLFILTKNALHLNGGYAVFGKVTSGMSVVDHIKIGERILTIKVLGKD